MRPSGAMASPANETMKRVPCLCQASSVATVKSVWFLKHRPPSHQRLGFQRPPYPPLVMICQATFPVLDFTYGGRERMISAMAVLPQRQPWSGTCLNLIFFRFGQVRLLIGHFDVPTGRGTRLVPRPRCNRRTSVLRHFGGVLPRLQFRVRI